MIEKYKSEVLLCYEQKRDAGELTSSLTLPTPAKICKEVRLLLASACDNADLRTLKDFLELPFDKPFLDVAYKKWDVDKFKPLCTFLKRKINTREKNIELLAWLIDFRPRPFSNYWRISKGKPEPLSDLLITETGIMEPNNIEVYHCRKTAQNENYSNLGIGLSQIQHREAKPKEAMDYPEFAASYTNSQKGITLEYPSGVKLSIDTSDLSLISKLLRL
jgi:hypothetical protein